MFANSEFKTIWKKIVVLSQHLHGVFDKSTEKIGHDVWPPGPSIELGTCQLLNTNSNHSTLAFGDLTLLM